MRVVIDAMGAPDGSGGMQLYARELVTAWAETFANDELIVVGGRWAVRDFANLANVQVSVRDKAGVASRLWSQSVHSGVVFHRERADALLSVSTIASPLVPSRARAVVIHDWRHVTRPAEFGSAQRAYRKLWNLSIRSAGTVIAISEKTARETRAYSKPKRLEVIRNGSDHARRWPKAALPTSVGDSRIITFGHLPNKRPELAIDAFARVGEVASGTRLVVLGASGPYRDELRARAVGLGVADRVDFPGFVDERSYQSLVSSAIALMLVSSDEGFGLPVVEARYFGVPALVTSDSGLADIHDFVIAAAPEPDALAEELRGVLAEGGPLAAPAPAMADGWVAVASKVRATLAARSER